jgi:copper oxidase (laccase) domain-containing protein
MSSEAVEILHSPVLNLPGILHGWPTRHGGVSTGKRASLNLGQRWGDSPRSPPATGRIGCR